MQRQVNVTESVNEHELRQPSVCCLQSTRMIRPLCKSVISYYTSYFVFLLTHNTCFCEKEPASGHFIPATVTNAVVLGYWETNERAAEEVRIVPADPVTVYESASLKVRLKKRRRTFLQARPYCLLQSKPRQ